MPLQGPSAKERLSVWNYKCWGDGNRNALKRSRTESRGRRQLLYGAIIAACYKTACWL